MSTVDRVLVTGAGGFIGSHCINQLLAQGAEVHALSRRIRPHAPKLRWHLANLHDPKSLDRVVEAVAPTHLLHLAWVTEPGDFWSSRENLNWLETSVRLFDRFGSHGGMRAVGIGSCAEYSLSDELLDEEHTDTRPATVYGRCKLAAHEALVCAAAVHRFSWAWARVFSPYGPGEPAKKFIPYVIRQLLNNRQVECSSGEQIRDFVYVSDIADALSMMTKSKADGVFNIGSGNPCPLGAVVEEITRQLGKSELVKFGSREREQHDPDMMAANTARIREIVGWSPKTNLHQGIKASIQYWRKTETRA